MRGAKEEDSEEIHVATNQLLQLGLQEPKLTAHTTGGGHLISCAEHSCAEPSVLHSVFRTVEQLKPNATLKPCGFYQMWKLLVSRAELVRLSICRGPCRSAASSNGGPIGAARRCQCSASSRACSVSALARAWLGLQ